VGNEKSTTLFWKTNSFSVRRETEEEDNTTQHQQGRKPKWKLYYCVSSRVVTGE